MTEFREVVAGIPTQRPGVLKWLPIYMYHHVVRQRRLGMENVEVTAQEFEEQMRYLKDRGYRVIPLAEAVRGLLEGDHAAVDRTAVITFDDGYMDVYHHAFPILKRYRFTADLFLIGSNLDRPNAAELDADQTPHLGMAQIEEMAAGGFSFGSHSISHRRLTSLSPQEAWEEVQGSKWDLERRLGLPVHSFSFPHGSSTPTLLQMVEEAGYLTACGIEQREHELFNLSRIDASRCRGADFRWQVRTSGMYFSLRQRNTLRWLKALLLRSRSEQGPEAADSGISPGEAARETRLNREAP
jgi:peptidoglycan/xylan/chitin deacetylase (PgdA/CDA1 family)